MDKKHSLIILWTAFVAVYVFLYFFLTYSVFFNFDMPRTAFYVQEFLKNGSYLTSQFFMRGTVWGGMEWGPALVFYYAFFMKFSSDPMIVSYMLSIANLLPLAALFIFVKRSFGLKAAVISTGLLSLHPYWLIYVRLIYNPSPLTFYLPISMFLFFEGVFKKKMWAILLLPISWAALIQTYLPTYSFILTSVFFIFLLSKKEELKKTVKYLIAGIGVSMLLLAPTLFYIYKFPGIVHSTIAAPSQFTPHETTIPERLASVLIAFIQIPVGGAFNFPLGYAIDDFAINHFPVYPWATLMLIILFLVALIWNFLKGIRQKDYRRLVMVFWAIAPAWSLMILWVTDMVPRYFLIAMPAAVILVALFMADLVNKSKIFLVIPVAVGIYWISFNFSYNMFLGSYEYPHGKLGDSSETSYVFIKDAVDYIVADSKWLNCNPVVSNEEGSTKFDVWYETEYEWYFRHNKNMEMPTGEVCYYLLTYKFVAEKFGVSDYKTFGSLVVFRYDFAKTPQIQESL